ncbi:MAG: histidine kinase dimerization/phospho-acceptor domain-containing protein, partial [Candidatus Helarchaeota archaeon]
MQWSGFAQRLAHEIKNPLSTINLTLQRIQHICKAKFGKEAKVLDQYTDSILEEVARLRNTTDKFMRILSIKKPEFTDN